MNAHTLRVLEYDRVKEQVRQHAACQLGLNRIDEMTPQVEIKAIRAALDQVKEARRMRDLRGHLPLGGVRDIRSLLEKAGRGGLLQPDELLAIEGTLASAGRLRAFLLKSPDDIPNMAVIARRIGQFPRIEEEITRCISDKGEVVDGASPLLGTLRARLKTAHARMMERLNSIIRSSSFKTMLQDAVITIRDDRYCIPVKAESRREFGGLVHDQSSSGATVFMEPTAVVELGNEIRELQIKERQEVERILRVLTEMVGGQLGPLQQTVLALAELDFINARAGWAESVRAVDPELDDQGVMELWGARHPLLEGSVVPIDVRLGQDFQALLITGPNTGGKTVTLKTVGLLTLLAQSGLPIPADEGSRIAVFPKVFADIGDEQSIQQSLSTFSSHIRNIVGVLEAADARTLVLLDEIGAGTDPAEGSALAKAVIQALLERGARLMASTHYGELKEFGLIHPGVENASVEFDQASLRPTYRLMMGSPGASQALNIAARLGMPPAVIASAREMFNPDRAGLEEAYRRMDEGRRSAEQLEATAAARNEELDRLRRQYQRELDDLKRKKERVAAQAQSQADALLRRTRAETQQILQALRTATREGRTTETARQRLSEMERETARATQETRAALPSTLPEPDLPPGPELEDGEPQAGDPVLVQQYGREGVLVRADRGQAEVQVGAMRLTVPLRTLRKLRRTPQVAQTRMAHVALAKAATLSSELQMLGLRGEEALVLLDKYLDDARMAGISPVRIVHGKGTGALRRVVWEHLKSDPTIKAYHHPKPEEGGEGVTIVELGDGESD